MHCEHVVLLIYLPSPIPIFVPIEIRELSGLSQSAVLPQTVRIYLESVRLSKTHHLPHVREFSWLYQPGCSMLFPVSNKGMRELLRI